MSRWPHATCADVLILGGGMGGATVAAHLAGERRVVLLEREAACGYHTTGRSAAMFLPSYGADAIRPLTAGSRAFLDRPPQGFGGPLLTPRDALHIARSDQLGRLDALAARLASPIPLSAAQARAKTPILRASEVRAGVLEIGAGDIDVDRLHRGFLRQAREAGAEVVEGVDDTSIDKIGELWRVRAGGRSFAAPVLVNATGAWADETAAAAGVRPRGLQPLQRTVVLVDPPALPGFHNWPIVKDVDERFYFRPFAGRLLITPADEAPSPPCDARPDALDVACAMMRFHEVADHRVRVLRNRWAGLRTFAADRAPVIGWDAEVSGFFWFAGLGGFGIQTAPAAGRMARAQILQAPIPADLVEQGVDAASFDPGRAGLDFGQHSEGRPSARLAGRKL